MVVRDPDFWRRFSVAVHQDDLAKQEMQARPGLAHSYVSPSPPSSPPLASPASLDPLVPGLFASPMDSVLSLPTLQSPPAVAFAPEESQRRKRESAPVQPRRQPSKLRKSPSTRSTAPLLPPPPPPPKDPGPRSSPRLNRPKSPSSHSFKHRYPSLPPTPSRHSFRCPSSLSLSGRSKSNFRTWTTITGGADLKNRDSWLESQKRKKKQRTWICWCFWTTAVLLVAGVIVAILVLRAHGII